MPESPRINSRPPMSTVGTPTATCQSRSAWGSDGLVESRRKRVGRGMGGCGASLQGSPTNLEAHERENEDVCSETD